MKLKSVKLENSFIPEFMGNRGLPVSDQIVVEIKDHISNLQLSKYRQFVYKGDSTKVEYDDAAIMIGHVGKIKNLEIDGTPIDDGIKLADSKDKQLYPLMTEIRRFLLNYGEDISEGES